MNAVGTAIQAFERAPLPDALTRLAIRALVSKTNRALSSAPHDAAAAFARELASQPIALHADAANAQHYEVPAAFFALVLGPQRKYSCCLYETANTTLAEAEERALEEAAKHASLVDGQTILELGCGWGSLSLWMARRFPDAKIVAVSNSHSQRAYIEGRIAALGLNNLTIRTKDMNAFAPVQSFDRIVSVEMFEHMTNWDSLLARVRSWLKADGRLFLHVFAHRSSPYRFDHKNSADWIAQHFFTGGIMPSHGLIAEYSHLFEVEQEWRWCGRHYERTANDWLANFDRHSEEIMRLFEKCYGRDASLWHRRWRIFFLSTAGLFGHRQGTEWGVSHFLLQPA